MRPWGSPRFARCKFASRILLRPPPLPQGVASELLGELKAKILLSRTLPHPPSAGAPSRREPHSPAVFENGFIRTPPFLLCGRRVRQKKGIAPRATPILAVRLCRQDGGVFAKLTFRKRGGAQRNIARRRKRDSKGQCPLARFFGSFFAAGQKMNIKNPPANARPKGAV